MQHQIQFVEQRSITEMVPMFDAYKFQPQGRMQWAQRLAWRFLNWRKAMKQAYEPKITVTRHTVDADKFMERIFKQRRALMEGFHKEGQRLLIGSEDYAELMCARKSFRTTSSFAERWGATAESSAWQWKLCRGCAA